MATIRDVARLANVSVATVSNALNSADRVSGELRARVLAAVDKLGYAPHPAARSLRKRSSGLLGLVVGDITNPFFSDLFAAVEDAAAASGYLVLLCNSSERVEREEAHLKMLRSQRIDGLILAPTGAVSMNRAALLAQLEVPVVLVDRAMDGLGYDAVVLDNHRAAFEATRHLIAAGHRRIALVNGPEVVRTAADRLRGYREALLTAGIPLDPALVRDAGFQEAPACRAVADLLATDDPPTAIFATNNLMTVGAIRALADLGLRCPEDVSIIGIDDLPWADSVSPRLTAVAQPVREIGERALALVAERIAGSRLGPGEVVVMAPKLIVRRSCGAPAVTPSGTPHVA
ncbi:LacI family DNA-binding transcriptional regulator [Phreatobacter cathodiphilus]|uniref:LacI family transcriptional regulator n=1 Tax=Phreatobacter cathodiphilus TaxID=1868589 RepID=A0A2S0N892_9HYPH|nr:LacI family DNA-binding transcriptional regulator [Phreatobacter cathodiphilus]AVO44374.1 LacI family transcriptional regulator [Phreatobacter cathodiphilus]